MLHGQQQSQSMIQMAPQDSHPNLFQQAIIEHAAKTALASQQIQPGPSTQVTSGSSPFGALHMLSSSESSTSSGSSSSSGGSAASVCATNIPSRPMYQSLGPHLNMPFDLYV